MDNKKIYNGLVGRVLNLTVQATSAYAVTSFVDAALDTILPQQLKTTKKLAVVAGGYLISSATSIYMGNLAEQAYNEFTDSIKTKKDPEILDLIDVELTNEES